MTGEENVRVVRSAYAALNAGDLDDFVAHLHPDVRWTGIDVTLRPRPARGREAVRAHLEELLAPLETLSVEPDELSTAGDSVLIWAMHRGRQPGVVSEASHHFAHLVALADGRITRFRLYVSREKGLRALRAAAR